MKSAHLKRSCAGISPVEFIPIAEESRSANGSSLSYLRSFLFDKIKIDKSFIQDIANGAEPLAIVHAVAGLVNCLNMISIAEGVETQQRLEALQAIGCTEMQGYLFSQARPAKDVIGFFTQNTTRSIGVA